MLNNGSDHFCLPKNKEKKKTNIIHASRCGN